MSLWKRAMFLKMTIFESQCKVIILLKTYQIVKRNFAKKLPFFGPFSSHYMVTLDTKIVFNAKIVSTKTNYHFSLMKYAN